MFWSSRKTAELSLRYENVAIHPTAEIAEDVEIGPFSFIGPGCRIGEGCRIHNNVTLVANTVLGRNNEVYPGAVLGAAPQDKKYEGEPSWLVIGDENTLRECVTMHSGTRLGGGKTVVGSRNLLMASCHVAHDCALEDDIVMANNVLLGGHVYVEHHATFGGMSAVHHFVTIGESAFIGGMTRVSQDVPPYMLLEGNPAQVRSTNRVGLRRRGFPPEAHEALKEAHRMLYREGRPRGEVLAELEERAGSIEAVARLIQFFRRMEAGSNGRARERVRPLLS